MIQLKEIVDIYFSEGAGLVFFFFNKDIGKFTCPCFTLVFSDKKMFELSSKLNKSGLVIVSSVILRSTRKNLSVLAPSENWWQRNRLEKSQQQ